MRAAVVCVAMCGCASERPWTPLLADPSRWYSFHYDRGVGDDPYGIFKFEDGVLHILDVDLPPGEWNFGYVTTHEEFENYRLRFEYKWGTRKYLPDWKRDSGFFIHAVGPDMMWPRAVECQVQENDTGDTYVFDLATVETTIDPAIAFPTFLDGGVPYRTPRNANPNWGPSRVVHAAEYDSLTDWNTVEIVADGDSVEYRVNGKLSFRGVGIRQPDPEALDQPDRDLPLTRGRLVIQQEGAEVMYRNLELQQLE